MTRNRLPKIMTASSVVIVLVASACLAAPTAVLHDPPTGRMGEAVPITVRVEGVVDHEPDVTCFFRPQGSGVYLNLHMMSIGRGEFLATIPAEAASSLGLKYYIEVVGPAGAYTSRIGSREHPITLRLLAPEPESDPTAYRPLKIGAASVALVAIGVLGVAFHRRRTRKRVLDQLFWSKTLDPLIRTSGTGLSRHVGRLTGLVLDHPIRGRRQFSRHEILIKLKQVRNLDKKQLREDTTEYLGKGFELRIIPLNEALAIDEVRERVEHLSHDVAILSTAAWVLSSFATGDRARLLEPFEQARNVVQRAQDAVRHQYDAVAESLCDKLLGRWGEMSLPVAQIDEQCSPDDLARYVSESKALTADMMGRLLEYYSKIAERTQFSRGKFLVVALALAGSDGANVGDPVSIRQVFERRRLLEGSEKVVLASVVVRHAASLRSRLSAPNLDMGKLQGIHGEIEGLEGNLGSGLFSVAGLSEVVSLYLAYDSAREQVEQNEARSLDILVDDLEVDVQVEPVEPPAGIHSETEDHPVALELLRESAAELERAIDGDNFSARGFFMEHFETKAVRLFAARQQLQRVDRQLAEARVSGSSDATVRLESLRKQLLEIATNGDRLYGHPWIDLLTRCVICRRTMDWQARKQAGGSEQSELPAGVAITLVRKATQLESDLQDRIQKDRMHNLGPRAELGKRFLHRFSRSRVGFALLTEMTTVEVSLVA